MSDYRKLRVWPKAFVLAKIVYKLAIRARKEGHTDLADQMKASGGSIPFNIAEGSGHHSRKEFARFLTYSVASSCELESQLEFARDIRVISYAEWHKTTERTTEVRRMLRGLIKKLGE
jgi:four helix bundle protein